MARAGAMTVMAHRPFRNLAVGIKRSVIISTDSFMAKNYSEDLRFLYSLIIEFILNF